MKEEQTLAETETPPSQVIIFENLGLNLRHVFDGLMEVFGYFGQESFPLHGLDDDDEEEGDDNVIPNNEEEKGEVTAGEIEEEEMEEISWTDVWKSCCTHSAQEWRVLAGGLVAAIFSLYVFMLGLEFLSSGAKVMSGCKAGELFGGDDANSVKSLMIGVLSTVLLQSSSTTTSIIVSLVGSVVDLQQGIYMVMGAVREEPTIHSKISATRMSLSNLVITEHWNVCYQYFGSHGTNGRQCPT